MNVDFFVKDSGRIFSEDVTLFAGGPRLCASQHVETTCFQRNTTEVPQSPFKALEFCSRQLSKLLVINFVSINVLTNSCSRLQIDGLGSFFFIQCFVKEFFVGIYRTPDFSFTVIHSMKYVF